MDAEIPYASERLRKAREAILDTLYFSPDEVGWDIAPRIAELISAMKKREDAPGTEKELIAGLRKGIGEKGIVRTMFDSGDLDLPAGDDSKLYYTRAENYIRACGMIPTPDAIGQLTEVFIPCLRLMCERGYDPEGKTWRAAGWKGMMREVSNKFRRTRFHAWNNSNIEGALKEIPDLINYAGFLQRGLAKDINPWGEDGEPGPAYEHHGSGCEPGCPAYDKADWDME